MTPRPLHKWKSFWLGLLLLAFLGMAWVRTQYYVDAISWTRGPLTFGLMQDPRGVGYYRVELPTSLRQGFRFTRERTAKVAASSFPRSVTWSNEGIPGLIKHRSIHVAHWLLILLFLVPWLALLFWRVRKQRNPIR
jgi:hypothetical protein